MEWLNDVDTLIFGGGGIRGIALLGALEELEAYWQKTVQKSLWLDIANVGGASIGSIYACLLACRVPFPRMKELILGPIWNSLYQQVDIPDMTRAFGLIDARKRLVSSIEMFLAKPEETFAELKVRTGISLTVAVTCLDTGSIEYHNDILTPVYRVSLSIAASCAIPLIFAPIEINKKLYIDGAILANFPLPKHIDLKKTLAFKFDSGMTSFLTRKPSIQGLFSYIQDIIYMILNHSEKEFISKLPVTFQNHIVHFPSRDGIQAWNFHLTAPQRIEVYESGKVVMSHFIHAPLIVVGELMASFISDYTA